MENENQSVGPVKFADVNELLLSKSIDPRKTNANAVREMLGRRGSLATIQKHLQTLRTSAEPTHIESITAAPGAPRELVEAVWREAWLQAQARVAGSIIVLTEEREEARVRADSLANDVESLSFAADEAVDAAAAAVSAAAVATADAETARLAADALKTELADTIESTTAAAAAAASVAEAALATVTSDAATSAASAEKDAAAAAAAIRAEYELKIARQETKIETLNGVIDRLGAQLAEAKSLLHRDAQPHKESKK